MPRQKRTFASKAERLKHEAALERRRQRHHEFRTQERAKQAAEGETDFEELVAREKERLAEHSHQRKIAAKGGSASPKVTIKARDNLADAFDLMGGVPALVVWGRKNPTEFYRIWARLIPREAADATVSLPLEDLLAKLANREALSVGEAAAQIGEEAMLAAREAAKDEDDIVLYRGESIQ